LQQKAGIGFILCPSHSLQISFDKNKIISHLAVHKNRFNTFTTSKRTIMSTAKKDYKRITTKSLFDMKANGEKISMLTAYDYTMAKIVDSAGVDVIILPTSAMSS
jgi:hypothetical protein